jgi:hypothetical protein
MHLDIKKQKKKLKKLLDKVKHPLSNWPESAHLNYQHLSYNSAFF